MALYAFDGTWNDSSAPDAERDTSKDTNVHRFRALYGGEVFYESGVGTRYGLIGKLIGGATGAGGPRRIEEQFERLEQSFAAGDTTVDVIGYSRGAAIARMFVQRIAQDFRRLRDAQGQRLAGPPPVRFVGLFDTVASFGIPWNDDDDNFAADIPSCVEHTFHAMALDETRETFGIERCLGNRDCITEVWFRGGHGDIGGNATYVDHLGERANRERSNIPLNWMLAKAQACGLPVPDSVDAADGAVRDDGAPVTAQDEPIRIGNAGTLSRRIHIGDLVHHSVERTELTRGIDGRLLRRIAVLTRIEDAALEVRGEALDWIPPEGTTRLPDNQPLGNAPPSLVQLSLRRYPFDVLPARTWSAWLALWDLQDDPIAVGREDEFWAPGPADRALAWDLLVEMQTRVSLQSLADDEGDDLAALKSVYDLFGHARAFMHRHGVDSANTSALITAFLNHHVRPFTARWHRQSLEQDWGGRRGEIDDEFRAALKALQPRLERLAGALSQLADARL